MKNQALRLPLRSIAGGSSTPGDALAPSGSGSAAAEPHERAVGRNWMTDDFGELAMGYVSCFVDGGGRNDATVKLLR